MCIYISAIVPNGVDVARIAGVAARYNKDFRPFTNVSIQSQLSSGESLFLTTIGHCDCDSALGSGRLKRRDAIDPVDERSKLARKGWSGSKIERALSQRIDKANAREQDENSELAKDLENWLGFLRAVLSSKDTPYIGLLFHNYSGSLETEEIIISDRMAIEAAGLNHETLADMDQDVIYRISASV